MLFSGVRRSGYFLEIFNGIFGAHVTVTFGELSLRYSLGTDARGPAPDPGKLCLCLQCWARSEVFKAEELGEVTLRGGAASREQLFAEVQPRRVREGDRKQRSWGLRGKGVPSGRAACLGWTQL